ncbi:MAG: CCA-adding protein, partial [Thermoplasmata archaeon]
MKEIIDEVLKRIIPTPEEEKKRREIVGEIKREIDERKPPAAESMLVGSVAKGTWLKNSLDIDFFLLFPPSYTKEEMAENVISIGKEILKDAIVQ